MTTMLEKAARAMALLDGEDPDMGTWNAGANQPGPKVWETYAPKVRAALLAIREPDAVMVSAAEQLDPLASWWPDEPGERNTPQQHFTAMIDAILSEGKA